MACLHTSKAVEKILQVLLGALIAAGASLIAALLTAWLARRRETRARLFDVRREAYTEALRFVSLAQHTITAPPTPHLGAAPLDASRIMAELELLGSPAVHSAFVDLTMNTIETHEFRHHLVEAAKSDDEAIQLMRDSSDLDQQLRSLQILQGKLISKMRKDLGGQDLRVKPGAFGPGGTPSLAADTE
jgi:hypothetical protein